MEEKNKKIIKTAAATAALVAGVGGGLFILYKRDKLTWDDLLIRDYRIASLAPVIRPKYDELNKTAPIKKSSNI